MLNKFFILMTLTLCTGLQASTEVSSQLEASCKCKKNRKPKNLKPGVLVCNSSEERCLKEGDTEESNSSILFAVFSEDQQDEKNLLACKNCE